VYRKLTARRHSSLDVGAIATGPYTPAFPLFRADPDPAVANKKVLRLLTAYTLLWLPVHAGICVLSAHALGLAVGAVFLAAGVLLLLALAKRLAFDDLLLWLPLLLVLALIVLGVAFLVSRPRHPAGVAGVEFFGTVVVLVTIVSILGSLHRPLTAAYQAVAAKTSSRDLCVGALAILASLALAAFVQAVPRPVLAVIASTVCGGFAGLVVLEYAAWARANPHIGLLYVMSVGAPIESRGPRRTIEGACYLGLGRGLIVIGIFYTVFPSPQLDRLLLSFTPEAPNEMPAVLGCWVGIGLLAMMAGFSLINGSLNAPLGSLTLTDFRAGFQLSWNALRLFLTYPEVGHPLAHRMRLRWLRPVSVRLALTGLVLATAATPILAPGEKASASGAELTPTISAAETLPPAPPTAVDTRTVATDIAVFVLTALNLVITPLLIVYGTVWLVGLTVLPTYFNRFEKPQVAGAG
jgi:hypothetical protein